MLEVWITEYIKHLKSKVADKNIKLKTLKTESWKQERKT